MERKMMDGNGGPARRGRRGACRRRSSRPSSVRARRAAIIVTGSLERLARQTALMILAGGAVGVTGRDVFHAAATASLAASRNGREAAIAAQAILAELDLLPLPTVAAVYHRVGREAWRQRRELGEQAEARLLQSVLEASAPPGAMH